MSDAPPTPRRPSGGGNARRKTLAQVAAENESHGLKKSLTASQLLLLGIGTIIGAGIYVMTGTAAAEYAGPSIMLSFIIAAVGCLFTALCYGELASTYPVSGSAYSYAYISMGEKMAWTVGWVLLLDYGISCTAVAAGLSGYANSLLATFGLHLPSCLTQATLQPVPGSDGTAMTIGWRFDFIGFLSVMVVTWLLVRGVEESARFNTLIVALKVGVLLLFLAMGISAINPANWHPFIPPAEPNFHYGLTGIFRAAALMFFTYSGFEAVSTAASEARNPTRDVPIGIIGSLLVCTALYLALAAVLLGIVPYRQLDVADPLAVATQIMGHPWLSIMVNSGATIGLCAVLLGLMYAQSRVLLTIGRDGLIPRLFAHVHKVYRTPAAGTLVLGLVVAIMTATLPIDILADLVSAGTTAAFAIVCFTVIWQRTHHPETPRPFQVPLGGIWFRGVWLGVTPILGMLFAFLMTLPLLLNMVHALLGGNPVPIALLGIYLVLGVLTYVCYGRYHSRLGRALQKQKDDQTAPDTPPETRSVSAGRQ
ncbi:APC family permease [Oecophyllibacter saccharovorans]|uniref:Amino acid permease n=1 Tax=Oecophyllibacter saccharovorans TaxID=2558360 RepID=A0A506UQT7_9PROT|nr:amino acid permease [Oecophyllibacter saccharovorans]TPW35731.1 amino acid permease [Oecophyllibacter saccharovorans]